MLALAAARMECSTTAPAASPEPAEDLCAQPHLCIMQVQELDEAKALGASSVFVLGVCEGKWGGAGGVGWGGWGERGLPQHASDLLLCYAATYHALRVFVVVQCSKKGLGGRLGLSAPFKHLASALPSLFLAPPPRFLLKCP